MGIKEEKLDMSSVIINQGYTIFHIKIIFHLNIINNASIFLFLDYVIY